jgi:D-xylose transport system permease protein
VTATLSSLHNVPAFPALLAGIGVGLAIGAINGFFVAVMRVPSFIVTLAAYIFYSGVLLHILFPQTTLLLKDPFLTGIMSGYVTFPWDVLAPIPLIVIYAAVLLVARMRRARLGLRTAPQWTLWTRIGAVIVLAYGAVIFIFEGPGALGVPDSLFIVLGLVIVLWLLLRFTTYGRHVYAVGGSPEAARRAGISVIWIRISAFALGSMLAGLGGILEASRENSAATQVEPTLLLLSIAVAVIGGVSLFGGRGSVWGVLLGILIIGSLQNGLTLFTSAGNDLKYMFEGAVLMIAVLFDAITRRRNAVSGR